ncbi:MAG: family 16 glycoside hydrolase, partial [bacterium]
MAFGLARHIPNELTLRNLDLDETEPTEIFASELEEIPEGNPVPHFEYPIGTILKNSETNDDEYYLITPAGEKKLIPNKQTLENLGLDISKVKPVPSSKLEGISNDPERFPHIEYPNGTILKGPNNTLYVTQLNTKIEVPDETTLEAHGLNTRLETITIRAKGTQAGGTYPLIQLRVDGQTVKEWFVSNEFKDYTVTIPLSSGKHTVDVVYPNDQDTYTQIKTKTERHFHHLKWKTRVTTWSETSVTADRTLWIDNLQVGNQKIEAEDFTAVKYDRANNQNINSALDGQGVEAGREQLDNAGALRFEVETNPVINVTESDLAKAKMDTIFTLQQAKYPNGTVIRNQAGDKIYLMQNGTKQEIKNDKTIEALGIEKDTPIPVSTFNFKELNTGKRIYDLIPVSGQWTLNDGVYHQDNMTGLSVAKLKETYSDFIFKTKIKATETTYATDCRYINFRAKDEQNQYVLQIFGTHLNLYRVINGNWTCLAEVSRNLPLGTWADYKIVANGDQIQVYENDRLIADIKDNSNTSGSIYLRSYKTKVSFDNIRITNLKDNTLVEENPGLIPLSKEWNSRMVTQNNITDHTRAKIDGIYSDFIFETKIKAEQTTHSTDCRYINFRVKDEQNQYVLQIFGTHLNLYRVVNGNWTCLAEVSRTLPLGTWAEYKIVANGDQIKVYENDRLIADIKDNSNTSGSIYLRSYKTKVSFDNIRITNLKNNAPVEESPELTPLSGQWDVGVVTQNNITAHTRAKIDGIYSDFIFETKIKAEQTTHPTDCRYINFRVKDEQNQYVLQIFGTHLNLYRVVNGSWTRLAEVSRNLPLGTWANYKVVAHGDQIKVYENDRVIADVKDNSISSGEIILQTYKTQASFDETKVTIIKDNVLSDDELSEIPKGSLLEAKYPNGTVLEDIAGNMYMMSQGIRKLIPDETTLEVLGLTKGISTSTLNIKKMNEGKRIYDLSPVSGQWTLNDGVYHQDNMTGVSVAKLKEIYSDFIFKTKIKATQTTYATDCRYINFRAKDEQNQYVLQIFGTYLNLYRVVNGNWTCLAEVSRTLPLGTWAEYKIVANGDQIQVY